jgi:hypothetical protein|tara:strand:+ start:419 stop:781 length:363 start_codon:yes stop_codon:yes gene_type:complete
MAHLGLIILIVLSIEILTHVKILSQIKLNINLYHKLTKLFFSKKISDTWKEKLILSYSKKLLLVSLKICSIIILIILIIFILDQFIENILPLLLSFKGAVEASVFTIIYISLKNFFNAQL